MKTLEELKATFEECVQDWVTCGLALDNLDIARKNWKKVNGSYTKEQRTIANEQDAPFREKQSIIREQVESVFKDIIKIQPNYILELLQNYHEAYNFDALDLIIEYMRGNWYPHSSTNTVETRHFSDKLILRIAIELLDNQYLEVNIKVMWFVRQVYDIFFHQVNISGKSTQLTELFLQLSLKVLEPKFLPLSENEITEYSYSSCIYFIGMMTNAIADRPNDFFALWEKMQIQPDDSMPRHEWGWWTDTYERLTSSDKDSPTEET